MDPNPQRSWIRVQFGSGSTPLVPSKVILKFPVVAHSEKCDSLSCTVAHCAIFEKYCFLDCADSDSPVWCTPRLHNPECHAHHGIYWKFEYTVSSNSKPKSERLFITCLSGVQMKIMRVENLVTRSLQDWQVIGRKTVYFNMFSSSVSHSRGKAISFLLYWSGVQNRFFVLFYPEFWTGFVNVFGSETLGLNACISVFNITVNIPIDKAQIFSN